MRLRFIVPEIQEANFLQKLQTWNLCIVSKEGSGNQLSMICQIQSSNYRYCDGLVRDCKGRFEILPVHVHKEEDARHEQGDEETLTGNIHNVKLGRR